MNITKLNSNIFISSSFFTACGFITEIDNNKVPSEKRFVVSRVLNSYLSHPSSHTHTHTHTHIYIYIYIYIYISFYTYLIAWTLI